MLKNQTHSKFCEKKLPFETSRGMIIFGCVFLAPFRFIDRQKKGDI
jgi:hypothetical protein